MRTSAHVLAPLGIALTLAACGGGSSGSSPAPVILYGTGTGTLRVDAVVDSSPTGSFFNASTADKFKTTYEVRVRKMVTGILTDVTGPDATITFKVGAAVVSVPWDAVATRYRVEQPGGIDRALVEVDVTTTAGDSLHGLARLSPGLHSFTYPTPGVSVSLATFAGAPLNATWSRAAAADVAELVISNYGGALVPDTGSYAVPNAAIEQVVPVDGEPAKLRRSNVVDAAAAAALSGSSLEVSVTQEFTFSVVP